MDEPTLSAYLTLCETENTRDAAALLGVNQSNVSRALARLEDELGTALFDRHGRRLVLNRAGAAFRTDAAHILESMEVGRRHLGRLSGPDAVIRLGFLQSLARWAVPQVVRGFRATGAANRFELRQGFARDLFGWIADDLLDVALVTPPTQPVAGLGWSGLLDQRLSVALPAGHRLAERESLRAHDLDGEEFVALGRTTELRVVIDGLLTAAGARVRIAFESSELDTIRGLVGAGLGVSIVPRPAATDASDPVYVTLEPAAYRRLGLAWSTARNNPASVTAFLAASRRLPLQG